MSHTIPKDVAECTVTVGGKTKQYDVEGRVACMVGWLCHNERAIGSWSKGTVTFTYDGGNIRKEIAGED